MKLSGEIEVTHLLSTTALEILSYSNPIKEHIRDTMRTQIDWTAPGSVNRIQPESLEGVIAGAESEVHNGFQRLIAQTLVALWGTLEVMTEDLFVAWLDAHPDFLEKDVFQRIRVPLSDFIRSDRQQQLSSIYHLLRASLGEKQGINYFEAPLSHIGLSGPVDDEISRNLTELHALRNLIVHQGMIVDARFRQTEFGKAFSLGERVHIVERQFNAYQGSVLAYQDTVLKRLIGTKGAATPLLKS